MSVPFPQIERPYGWRTNLGDIGESGLAGEIVESEYFTASSAPVTTFGKVKIGGVVTNIIASHVKIGGTVTPILSRYTKIGGVLTQIT